MTSSSFVITCFTISFIFHFSSSSATHNILLSSEWSENQEPRATKHVQFYEFNRLAHGHGSTGGGSSDNNNGGGRNMQGGGAAVPVIIAGAANNNHHQRRGASACNSAKNIYWRGVFTLVTAIALRSF